MASEEDIKAIRNWLIKQPHLPQTLDDRLLSKFLRSAEDSLERTKSTLELFFTLRTDSPEVFKSRDPASPAVKDIFNLIDLLPLERTTPDGHSCFLLRFADQDPDKFQFDAVLKLFFMVGDVQIRSQDEGPVLGLVPMFDMSGWTFRHVTKIPISPLRKYMQYCQEALPVNLRQIHIINASPLLDKLLALIRPFMNPQVAAMIHTHAVGSTTLYQFVPQDLLPKEYGGKSGSVKEIKDLWHRKVEADRDWFLIDEWMSEESKRIGKRTLVQEGSFRALSFD